jgi:hypothetical protein
MGASIARSSALTESHITGLESVDAATLTPLVRQALGSETVEVTDWDIQRIHGGAAAGYMGGSAVHRISGQARDKGESRRWSLILKVLYPDMTRNQPAQVNYWRREAHAFESGVLEGLPDGVQAPQCFGVVDQPDGEAWIWMEDVREDTLKTWSLEQYGRVARLLGQLNGAYLAGECAVPPQPWLRQRSWLRDSEARRVADRARSLDQLRNSLDHPLVRRAYPPEAVDLLERDWEDHRRLGKMRLLDALDRLPDTLCHNDAFRRNLLLRYAPDGGLGAVAIDWDLVGIGWVGGEITKLVSHPLVLQRVSHTEARERDQIAFEGYLEGLRDAGWRGDSRQARFGQIAEAAIRLRRVEVSLFLDESHYAWLEGVFGLSMVDATDWVREFLLDNPYESWVEEAWELLDQL